MGSIKLVSTKSRKLWPALAVGLCITSLQGCNSSDDSVSSAALDTSTPPPSSNRPPASREPRPTEEPTVVPTISIETNSPVAEGDTAFLDGIAEDLDGLIERYEWTQVSGPRVTIDDEDKASASFTAPNVPNLSDAGTSVMTFELSVWDDSGVKATEQVQIDISDGNRPVADAGDDFTVFQGQEVTLDAGRSIDLSRGQIISYAWTQVRGEQADNFINTNNQTVRFDAPSTFRGSDMVFKLQVTDNEGNTSTDEVSVKLLGNLEETPNDEDFFLTFLNRTSPKFAATEEDSESYYRTVDPQSQRTTLESWYEANGYIINNENPNYQSACFENEAELGMGRVVRMRIAANGAITSAAENYLSVEAACNAMASNSREDMLSAGAMEFDRAADRDDGSQFSSFYAFGENGTRTTGIDFDGRGEKSVPGTCNTCHGGAPQESIAGIFPDDGNTGAVLLPFNLNALAFSDDPEFSQREQEANFREMNRLVLTSVPSSISFVRTDEGAYTGTPIREMIEGWYGGRGLPRQSFDDDFVPEGWLPESKGGPAGVPDEAEDLYLDVVEENCLVCHLARGTELENTIDFLSYEKFISYKEEIIELVYKQGVMPLAVETFQNFWSPEQGTPPAVQLAAAVGYDPTGRLEEGKGQLPGAPRAKIAAPVEAPNDEIINLNAEGSNFERFYEWEILSSPAGSSPRLIGGTTATPLLETDDEGVYEIGLTTITDNNERSEQDAVVITTTNDLREISFDEDVYQVVQENCAAACHKANGIQGIPIRFDNPITAHEFMVQYVNLEDPINSPILRKPSGNFHGGGTVNGFDLNGDRSNYDVMMRWILEGAENN